MNYDEMINSVTTSMKNQVKFEEQNGCPKDYFMAYSSLLRELNPLKSNRNIKDIWFNYRVFVEISDLYRNTPDYFSDIHNINGFNIISNVIKKGGAFVTFHYGNYRNLIYSIGTKIIEEFPNVPLAIVVDNDSYNNRPTKKDYLYADNYEYFIAESPDIAIKLARHVRKGGWFFIFLDGNTGAGVDKHGLKIDFVSSSIKIRSGFFRLLASSGKPIVPILADGPLNSSNFTIYDPVYASKITLEDTAQCIYERLKTMILDHPEYWRFWFRHYLQVTHWKEIHCSEEERYFSNLKCVSNDSCLVIDEMSGIVYKENI